VNEKTPRIIAGIATIAFPVLLLTGFVLHPHLLFPHFTVTAEDLIAKFRHETAFHVGHLIVFAAVPFIILSVSYVATISKAAGRAYGVVGGMVAIVGAVILAGDKGALCIVLSAFDTLSDVDFAAIRPALQAIVERRGLLMIFSALPLLPIGAVIQMLGMMKEGMVSRMNGVVAIVGLALLNNPDIDIVSSVGAFLMCLTYVPLGARIATGRVG
jgi:hypothetical protein